MRAVVRELHGCVGFRDVPLHVLAIHHRNGFVVADERDIEHRLHQTGLVLERLVDGLDRDARVVGNRGHRRRCVALFQKAHARGLEDHPARTPGLLLPPRCVVPTSGVDRLRHSLHTPVSVTVHCTESENRKVP
jgi:hypothetical protein